MLEDIQEMIANGATQDEINFFIDFYEEWEEINNNWED